MSAPPAGAPVATATAIVLPLAGVGVAGHRLADGKLLWTHPLNAERSLTADDDRVYVASGEAIHALDATTGHVAWLAPAGGPVTAPPLAHAGWVIAATAGEVLAIRASDGAVQWKRSIGPVDDFRPAIDGDLLVVPVADGRIVAINLPNGEVRWECDLGSPPTEPLVIDGRIYVGTQGKQFIVLHASNGRTDYRWDVGALLRGRAALDERHVFFAAFDNTLWALDRGNGAQKWRKPLTYRPASGPVLVGGAVVVPGYVASLPAFNPRTGESAGQITFADRLATLPLFLARDGELPLAIGITGNLENKWAIWTLEPSPVPSLPVQPLKVLPGEAVPLPQVPSG
jgi:outer membrane protein assembly factor BamB